MSIRKRGKRWYAELWVNGFRKGASFNTKAEAAAWKARARTEISDKGFTKDITVAELLDKYARDVSTKKRSERWEIVRLNALKKMPLASVRLPKLSAKHIAEWRDLRLKDVSTSTTSREWTLLSGVFSVAVNEWGFLQSHPMKGVKRPKEAPPRDRRITEDEIDRIVFVSGYEKNKPRNLAQTAAAAFLFAIETAMRAGEILKLTADDVDFEKRVATLRNTKNGFPRKVPLSTEAVRILREGFFEITSSQLDANFRKIKKNAGIENLHFHDSRHEAITRLAGKMDVLSLARMVGHRNLNQLMTYYNESAEDLAKRLG